VDIVTRPRLTLACSRLTETTSKARVLQELGVQAFVPTLTLHNMPNLLIMAQIEGYEMCVYFIYLV
jgi:hypothetical protein